MKNCLLLVFVLSVLAACNSSAPPKEVASNFIQAVYSADGGKAADLATEKTKAAVGAAKMRAADKPAADQFSLSTLTETVAGNTAEVKNEVLKLVLEKEGGDWKVSATPELMATLTEKPENLEQLRQKWEALLMEYKGRVAVAKEYVEYKKGQGALSAAMQNLQAMVSKLDAEKDWNSEKISRYVQDQNTLTGLLDKAHEPSYTAHADMSMNYFLQLSQAADRIKAAQADYNSAVAKTPSMMYPSLPGQ